VQQTTLLLQVTLATVLWEFFLFLHCARFPGTSRFSSRRRARFPGSSRFSNGHFPWWRADRFFLRSRGRNVHATTERDLG
jgi:hypothetical protein